MINLKLMMRAQLVDAEAAADAGLGTACREPRRTSRACTVHRGVSSLYRGAVHGACLYSTQGSGAELRRTGGRGEVVTGRRVGGRGFGVGLITQLPNYPIA